MENADVFSSYCDYLLQLRAEDALLVACARQNFTPQHRQLVESICARNRIDWKLVYEHAIAHYVAPLVYTNIRHSGCAEAGIPAETASAFQACLTLNVAKKQLALRRTEEFLAFCNQQGIDAMLIKGALYDQTVYERPWYTMSDDVDVLLRREEAAYSDEQHQEMGRLSAKAPPIEINCRSHHDVSMSVLPIRFDRIWQDAVPGTYGQQKTVLMPMNWMLMTACINACRKRFRRLKDLCDVVSILEKHIAIDWSEFGDLVRANCCERVVYAAFTASRMIFGYPLPQDALRVLRVKPLGARVISSLVENRFRCEIRSVAERRKILGLDSSLILPYSTYTPAMYFRKLRSLANR